MKIIVISDSHGNSKGIDKLFSDKNFDYLFFLGDGLSDLGTYINMENVIVVSGNCDFFSKVVNEKYFELQNKKIFMTHGNKYGVKSSLNSLIEKSKQLNADIVFYGHTHKQKIDKFGDIFYINPGSFSKNVRGKSTGLEIEIIGSNIIINKIEV